MVGKYVITQSDSGSYLKAEQMWVSIMNTHEVHVR